MSTALDQYIHRFQNMPGFNIHSVTPDGEAHVPWLPVEGEAIARELIFDEINPMVQVDTISADIQKWGRLKAHAQRVWTMTERELRRWKAEFLLKAMQPPAEGETKPGWTEDAKGKPKSPTVAVTESLYRTSGEYRKLNKEIERAEEAFNAAHSVLEGFRAKKDVLTRFARRYNEG